MFYAIKTFIPELHRRNDLLFYVSCAFTILFLIFLMTFKVCQYSAYEICFWLKPCKFAFSFAIYAITLAWYMEYLKDLLGEESIKRISWLTAILITIELVIIIIQSWLASDSSYLLQFSSNTIAFVNRNLYLLGNTIIIANTVVTTYIALQFFRPILLTPISYLWGIRAGFVIFILSGFLGAYLVGRYGQIAPDPTNYGIPFIQLSSTRDVLISMHFLGIHGLQLLPFCCYFFQQIVGKNFAISSMIFYTVICIFFISVG